VNRAADVAIAGSALVVTSPLLGVAALATKLGDRGPVLYRQTRVGKDGVDFELLKIRTMIVGAEKVGAGYAVNQGDPRITRVGRVLRKLSLDELPQFWNVMRGEMSVVGPRPHTVAHNEHYRKEVKRYMVRHKVKPGITGWAQVNGQRGETDTVEKMRTRVEYDLEYLRNWSLGLDLKIIASTIRVLFFDRQAY
jgi:putative colanic acid biosynthesis UDP-glucose lipid carrier transferase